ncbi:MAG: MCE family protein [Deltaproteobacteria bacterium]|nr:MCE family protein [Deltaproteobacteria bacterium]
MTFRSSIRADSPISAVLYHYGQITCFLIFLALALGCTDKDGRGNQSADVTLTVAFKSVEGLREGDTVLFDGLPIGLVNRITYNQQGRFEVAVRIKNEFRAALIESSRFYVGDNPGTPGQRALIMANLNQGGRPLDTAKVIEGTTQLSVIIEKGQRGVTEFLDVFSKKITSLTADLDKPSSEEQLDRLSKEIDAAAAHLEDEGQSSKEYFREQILPKLEKELNRLRQHLESLGRGAEIKPLNEKMNNLKKKLG